MIATSMNTRSTFSMKLCLTTGPREYHNITIPHHHQQKLAMCLLLFIRSDLWCYTGLTRKKDDGKATQTQDMCEAKL